MRKILGRRSRLVSRVHKPFSHGFARISRIGERTRLPCLFWRRRRNSLLHHAAHENYLELGKQEPRNWGERGLKLVRLPPSLAATLAALPSISEIPFLDSCVPAFLIQQSFRSFVLRLFHKFVVISVIRG